MVYSSKAPNWENSKFYLFTNYIKIIQTEHFLFISFLINRHFFLELLLLKVKFKQRIIPIYTSWRVVNTTATTLWACFQVSFKCSCKSTEYPRWRRNYDIRLLSSRGWFWPNKTTRLILCQKETRLIHWLADSISHSMFEYRCT